MPISQSGFAPGSKGLNQERMVITELRMLCHISATLTCVAAWESSMQLPVFPSLCKGKCFTSIYTPVYGTVRLKTLLDYWPTFGHQKCPNVSYRSASALACLSRGRALLWAQAGAVPAQVWSSPWQSEPRECLCILHRQSQVLETDTRTCSFLPHEYPVSVSGNREVLCPCNGSVSLYFLPVPVSDWLSPSCGKQKPEVWATFVRGKKGQNLFLLKQKGLWLKRQNIVY